MIDERVANLIQAEVDGELPVGDRAELEEVLQRSGEARRFREGMIRVSRLMSELPPLEPPDGLRQSVLSQIDLPATPAWPDWSLSWLRPASYGMAVAAGMVLAVGLVNAVPGLVPEGASSADSDIERLVGTMVGRGERPGGPAEGHLAISGAGVQGEVRLQTYPDSWAVAFDLDVENPTEVRLDLAGAGVSFGGIADPQGAVQSVDVSAKAVRVINEGHQRFVVFLRPEPGVNAEMQHVAIAVSRDGQVLFSGRLQPGG